MQEGEKGHNVKDSQYIQSFVNGVRKARDRSLSSITSDSGSDNDIPSRWNKEVTFKFFLVYFFFTKQFKFY